MRARRAGSAAICRSAVEGRVAAGAGSVGVRALLKGTGEGREISTTMAFVRILNILLRDKALGKRVVPIVPDEARTFGMEGLFRQIGIYSPFGQKYVPGFRPADVLPRGSKTGQILQEGINEAGGMSSLDRRGDVVLDARRS
jgi:pyruvate dehydrogenase complex dehydrogenase (E1) component